MILATEENTIVPADINYYPQQVIPPDIIAGPVIIQPLVDIQPVQTTLPTVVGDYSNSVPTSDNIPLTGTVINNPIQITPDDYLGTTPYFNPVIIPDNIPILFDPVFPQSQIPTNYPVETYYPNADTVLINPNQINVEIIPENPVIEAKINPLLEDSSLALLTPLPLDIQKSINDVNNSKISSGYVNLGIALAITGTILYFVFK